MSSEPCPIGVYLNFARHTREPYRKMGSPIGRAWWLTNDQLISFASRTGMRFSKQNLSCLLQAVWWLAGSEKKHMNTRTPSCLWAQKTMFYKEAVNGILQLRSEILYTNNDFGKVLKHAMTFFKMKL